MVFLLGLALIALLLIWIEGHLKKGREQQQEIIDLLEEINAKLEPYDPLYDEEEELKE